MSTHHMLITTFRLPYPPAPWAEAETVKLDTLVRRQAG
jgi:hypothetical protein